MPYSFEPLRRMSYPGRLIAIGRDPSGRSHVVLYAVTGRSASSQARRLVYDRNAVWTQPTDPEVLKKGNPELLVYPAMILGRGIAVSNGKQTSEIEADSGQSPVQILEAGLQGWSYEPDAPIFTPRISGCLTSSGKTALAIIRRSPSGAGLRNYYEFVADPGQAKLISTYAGENRDPLPSFEGDPLDAVFTEDSAHAVAEAAYQALGPSGDSNPDFRVAVACLFAEAADPARSELHIINREERTRP